jgi:DNA-binding NarL/FixJ family response regulator
MFRHFETGEAIPLLVDWFRIDDPRTERPMNLATVSRDLRHHKRTEFDLRHLNDTLERRVLERTAELADAKERLLRMKLALPVIIMTGHGDVQSAVRAMKAGAVDFIEKPYSDDHLMGAIEAAPRRFGRGDRAIDIFEAAARIADLTPREREVLDALDLGISVRTVEVHRARMMDRLGVQQFAEAVRLAVLAQFGRHD